jgi:mannosyltransferase
MTYGRTLLMMTCVTLFAVGLRVVSLDNQSMWRDEIDTYCFAVDFWEVLQRGAQGSPAPAPQSQMGAIATGMSGVGKDPHLASVTRLNCQPTPGLNRVNTARGLWIALQDLLTLPGWNGPLYTVAMRPWISLTGDSPFALRYSSLLFGVLAVPLSFVLGRRLLGKKVGLIGAMLVAMSPHLVWYSQEAKMYSLVLALGLLAIYALRRALVAEERSAVWWVVMVAATTFAIYTHILTALLIPLEIGLAAIWWSDTRRHWQGALIALALLTLPYLPLVVWQARSWFLPAGQATLFTNSRLDLMLETTFDGWAGNFITEPWATLVLIGLALLALFAVAWDWRASVALLVWIFLPLLGIWLISARQPIFTNRYLIWAAPAFYLLAAAGFAALSRFGRGGAVVGSVLLLVVLVGDARSLLHQAEQPIKPDFQAAAAYMEKHYQPQDLIVFHLSYMENNFDYYYEGKFNGWGAPAPAGGWSKDDIDAQMRTATTGHGTVWLVLSEAGMWDPQGLVKGWMDENGLVPPTEQVFSHVSVYRYQFDE